MGLIINKQIILETAVEQVEVCDFCGEGQGVTTRNGYSIPRSYNTAILCKNHAIRPVADDLQRQVANLQDNHLS